MNTAPGSMNIGAEIFPLRFLSETHPSSQPERLHWQSFLTEWEVLQLLIYSSFMKQFGGRKDGQSRLH